MRTSNDASRQPPKVLLSAGETTSLMLGVCFAGFAAREHGACLGADVARKLTLHVPGEGKYRRRLVPQADVALIELPPEAGWRSNARVAQGVAHLRAGHDAGCHGFGVSLRELSSVATSVAPVGASEFLGELFGDVAAELAHMRAWESNAAGETLRHAVAGRITPTPLRQESFGAVRALFADGSRRR
ncbi:hypothetical protein [Leucobacter aridicollis]|uniref:hypothetical protein n=1 Tax=Leucobacter aridicollis TaxID=283878 RepID=UPI000E65DBA5|nr:hypothetical protein [Leucobacter aridicollis]UTX51767.1 hypothetical protein KI794_08165 [Leucobacter aridicollis]